MTPAIKKEIRVRIAPSPTGYLHVGTARSALFNWLFAKKEGGKFILRIEDTDLERSEKKFEKDIIESLKWLGLSWDEGPFLQSDRLDVYEKYIRQLLEQNLAYYCYCTKEDLENERQAMLSQGMAPKYSGRCRSRTKTKEKPQVIRFKVPETRVAFKDLIRGEISFDTSLIGDIAIAKDPRTPLYNFAVVIDDYEMQISHVIRGEDHIANTPKQILIQKALNFPHPHYGHLPLILDPDRSKMSKRYSATSIGEYRKEGYLPEAMVNFMAFLGWHPKDEKELMTADELVKEFDLERIQKGGAVFNIEKLNWINSQYIKNLSNEELLQRIKDFGFAVKKISDAQLAKIAGITKERMKKLSDFSELADFFFELPDYSSELLIWKETPRETIKENLEAILKLAPDSGKIMKLAEEKGRGEILWPLRAALSGKMASPGPLEIMDILGEKESAKRIKTAIKKLSD
ncbi:MAG: glutamate--tRNA ligase [Patescibacteria group bacterium]